MTDPVVRCCEHQCDGGRIVAQAQLDSSATLNALSLEMVRLLGTALHDWAVRDDVVAVVVTGDGDKAFCAGGDIQALYHAMRANHESGRVVDDYPFRFFAEEYRLGHFMHTYAKPLVTIGHGIVMGGGLGILSASRYRVLTEQTRLALPEISIGLFPDAGASWTLGNMPRHQATFLGLTGSRINAADGMLLGIGTHCIEHAARDEWCRDLAKLSWQDSAAANHEMLQAELVGEEVALPPPQITSVPERQVNVDDLAEEVAAICALGGRSDWLDRGIDNLRRGCPTTAGIVLEQLRRVPGMSLADTYRMELTIATHCARNADFAEGIRALLIDKDNAPRWRYPNVGALPRDYVLGHFVEPWQRHPLADLH